MTSLSSTLNNSGIESLQLETRTFHLPLLNNSNALPTAAMSDPSSSSGPSDILAPQYTPEQIEQFNKELDGKTPQEVLVWAIDHLEGLYQTTAFGL
jgi:phosphoadenosine phosphosulfate reductase